MAERQKIDPAADLHGALEAERAALARVLHDDTGAMLAAARMDISWTENHINGPIFDIGKRLQRARQAIDHAIAANRKVIEQLHPTALDTFGLPMALRALVSGVCEESKIACTVILPETAPPLATVATLAVYRLIESVLAFLIAHRSASLSLEVSLANQWLTIKLQGGGLALLPTAEEARSIIAAVEYRLHPAQGDLLDFVADGEFLALRCRMPVSKEAPTAMAPTPGTVPGGNS